MAIAIMPIYAGLHGYDREDHQEAAWRHAMRTRGLVRRGTGSLYAERGKNTRIATRHIWTQDDDF